jgi:SAM-dependent methyltransferase
MGKLQGQSSFFRPGPPARPGEAYKPIVDFLLREVRGQSVLDLGGGEGAYSLELSRAGYDVTVADINPESIKVATENGLKTQLLQSGESLGDGIADTVMLIEVLEHVQDPKAFLQSAIRVAKKRVVFTLPCTEDFDSLFRLGLSYAHVAVSDHMWHFSLQEMKQLLDSLQKPYTLRMGDYLFPHVSMAMMRERFRGPLGFAATLPVRVANRLGLVPKGIPSRFYGFIDIS